MRLDALRRIMREEQLEAFVVPTADPHDSEYLPPYWQTRAWLTGFTGSAGTAVVTASGEAVLWTDSRYFLQAEQQLAGSGIMLMREGDPSTPSMVEWLLQVVAPKARVGVAAATATESFRQQFLDECQGNLTFVAQTRDPFDALWQARPPREANPIEVMPTAQAAGGAKEKLARIYRQLTAGVEGEAVAVLSDLSEIAWALGLRGSDIPYNPLFYAYLILRRDSATLCVKSQSVPPAVASFLKTLDCNTVEYDGWREVLQALPRNTPVVLTSEANLLLAACCREAGLGVTLRPSPVPALRAIKTVGEQVGFRTAMERDGIAMVRFLRRLPAMVATGRCTEVDVDQCLTALRAEQEGFCSLSFATIAGYGANGAVVHYEAEPATAATLAPRGLLLLDSGAHYDCGTTDITRTIPLGSLTPEERLAYTLVLKGHIALAACRFPEGTTGIQLDLAARYAMWREGYDFGHGTGHGVGTRLCVHEGPQQVRKNVRPCTLLPLEAGMTITDEPGIYVPGKFGVRIENTLLVQRAGETHFGRFLHFEALTLCPIATEPLLLDRLTAEERNYLNAYHAEVRRRLLPLLADEEDRAFLQQATAAI